VWTDEASEETDFLPMTCVGWYEAFLFCAWDGGRLPTEAEWEMAAAGGAEDRLYPWGFEEPDVSTASYQCEDLTLCTEIIANGDCCSLHRVGTHDAGKGRWGHQDLGGSVREMVFDAYRPGFYTETQFGCIDCASTTYDVGQGSKRVMRGGGWSTPSFTLRGADRQAIFAGSENNPNQRIADVGFRCARPGLPASK
jgi:formylglycine-generating enzyme required for sulfatase activity